MNGLTALGSCTVLWCTSKRVYLPHVSISAHRPPARQYSLCYGLQNTVRVAAVMCQAKCIHVCAGTGDPRPSGEDCRVGSSTYCHLPWGADTKEGTHQTAHRGLRSCTASIAVAFTLVGSSRTLAVRSHCCLPVRFIARVRVAEARAAGSEPTQAGAGRTKAL